MSFVDDLVLVFLSSREVAINVRARCSSVDQVFDTAESLMGFARDVLQNDGNVVFTIPVRALMLLVGLCQFPQHATYFTLLLVKES